MKRTFGWILFLVVDLIFVAAALAAEGPTNDVVNVLRQFPGYHILKAAERNHDASEFVLHRFPHNNASIVHADFDGDGHADYALLLKNDKTKSAKFVVLLCFEDVECKNVHELDLTGTFGDVYIRPTPIGSRLSETEAIDTKDHPAPVKLHTVGIELNYFEKGAVVYYWERKTKKVESIQTED